VPARAWHARVVTPPASFPAEITGLLRRWKNGDDDALHLLVPVVYSELRRLAASYLRRERPGHTLQPTALVSEAFLRLAGRHSPHVDTRQQFFALAAQAMRRVLVDHARRRRALRRGGGAPPPFPALSAPDAGPDTGVLELDAALSRLEALDPRQARVVELRFFGGLELEETASALGLSISTVQREWRMARAWLRRELKAEG
jgi:RNA polymerase sigma factor (TIGR02999 family)